MRRQVTPVTLEGVFSRCEDFGECRLWGGSLAGEGREPRIYVGSKPHSARRWVYEAFYGVKPPPGKIMGVSCGERLCLEPRHLKPMTRSELQSLNYAAGLSPEHISALTRAARNRANLKLSMEIAREIRASSEPSREEAKRRGVSKATICRIRRNEAWSEMARGASVFHL